MAPRVIEIAGRKVGEGYPPIISAEVGLNHGGDIKLAHTMIQVAKEIGCDAVKVQNYRTADFVKTKGEIYDNGHGFWESMWSLCQRCELSYEDLKVLKATADHVGIIFHSTPTSREGVDDLVKLGVSVLKNGADYWQNDNLVWYMFDSKIPCIFSTAKGFGELDRYGNFDFNNKPIVLHTVREYPAKDWDQKRFLQVWRYHELVGYSDHTIGIDAAVEAVKLGACWIEKHFTLDKTMHGPDHHFSADPQEMAALVKEIRK